MNIKKPIIAIFSLSLLLGACKKKDNDNNGNNNGGNSNSTLSILTTKKWKMTSSTSVMDISGNPQTYDLYANLPACQQDNLYIFETNNTNKIDEGATKCSASDPQTRTDGTWELLSNNTKLKMTGSASVQGLSEIIADILEINSSVLKVKYVTNINGITMTTTTAYAAQ